MNARSIVPALLAAGLFAAPSPVHAQQGGGMKIAFVDLEYALNNVDEGKKAKAVLQEDYQKKKDDLESAKAEIDHEEADLAAQSLVLSDDVKRQKEADLEAKKDKYEKDKAAAFDAWQKKEASLTKDLLERLTAIVQQMGREGNYTFILERHDASVLYAQQNIDITSDVIARFNKNGGKP